MSNKMKTAFVQIDSNGKNKNKKKIGPDFIFSFITMVKKIILNVSLL